MKTVTTIAMIAMWKEGSCDSEGRTHADFYEDDDDDKGNDDNEEGFGDDDDIEGRVYSVIERAGQAQ